nr:hypothetical protein [Cupriavidus sp. UME77]
MLSGGMDASLITGLLAEFARRNGYARPAHLRLRLRN